MRWLPIMWWVFFNRFELMTFDLFFVDQRILMLEIATVASDFYLTRLLHEIPSVHAGSIPEASLF